eukprot:TRINITY_DN2855_c0_g1_i1.p1 TRINITY_DN2855_c0_g1~~TRINITY_DN2855_c0_g1_i1.p1  ORF type:complete len:411 (-),score=70.23 TRINITY_DN2855_c0_g1_i1:326-1558(-)
MRSGAIVFDWPGVTLMMRISGTVRARIKMDGAGNCFDVRVDGELRDVLVTGHGVEEYGVELMTSAHKASGHICLLEIVKRTEARCIEIKDMGQFRLCRFLGVMVPQSAEVARYSYPDSCRKIEFCGDSDTAGFGCLGRASSRVNVLSLDKREANACQSWAALVSKAFGAAHHNISHSGIGAAWNAPLTGVEGSYVDIYDRRCLGSVANLIHENHEDIRQELPPVDLVVVALGGNDCITLCNPGERDDQAFIRCFVNLLTIIRMHRRTQPILVLTPSPSTSSACADRDEQLQTSTDLNRLIDSAVGLYRGTQNDQLISVHMVVPRYDMDFDNPSDWGTMGHWSVQGHAKFATGVIPEIQRLTGWIPSTHKVEEIVALEKDSDTQSGFENVSFSFCSTDTCCAAGRDAGCMF